MREPAARIQRIVIPAEIDRWNWGAFLLNWIWGVGNNTFIALLTLVPLFGLIMPFVLGARGSAWAWQNGRWDSLEHFKRVQRKWAIWGAVIWIGTISSFAAIIGGALYGLRYSEAYELGASALQASARAADALGTPIATGMPLGVISHNARSGGKALLGFSATGSKAAGRVSLEAAKADGAWRITSLTLKVDGRDEVIDIAGGPAVNTAPATTVHPASRMEAVKRVQTITIRPNSPTDAPALKAAPTTPPPVEAGRAVLNEEDPTDARGKSYAGTVAWRAEMASPAESAGAPRMVVRGDIQVPGRINAVLTVRKPKSTEVATAYTIEITFDPTTDAVHGGVASVPGILMKPNEWAKGTPLAAQTMQTAAGSFVVKLSGREGDRQKNLKLLEELPRLDIPIAYKDGIRAALSLDKGARVLGIALASWGESFPDSRTEAAKRVPTITVRPNSGTDTPWIGQQPR